MRFSILILAALPLAAQSSRAIAVDGVPGAIYFSTDGKTLAAACRDNQVRTFDVATGKQLRARKHQPGAALLAADRLVERIDKKGVQVWDLTEERMLQLLEAAPVRGRTAISKDGKLLATADVDTRQVRLFDVASGKPKHSLADGLGGASELVFSPNGEALVAANYDNDIRVWKTRSGELVRKIEDMTGAMFAAQFTPDGKQLLMAGLDETIYVLDGASFQKVRTIKGHGETIAALAISPNGKLFVTGGFDVRTTQNPVKVVIWDAATGKALKTVSSPHRVIALAFSPDSRWIAMTSGEKEIALFQAQ